MGIACWHANVPAQAAHKRFRCERDGNLAKAIQFAWLGHEGIRCQIARSVVLIFIIFYQAASRS